MLSFHLDTAANPAYFVRVLPPFLILLFLAGRALLSRIGLFLFEFPLSFDFLSLVAPYVPIVFTTFDSIRLPLCSELISLLLFCGALSFVSGGSRAIVKQKKSLGACMQIHCSRPLQ